MDGDWYDPLGGKGHWRWGDSLVAAVPLALTTARMHSVSINRGARCTVEVEGSVLSTPANSRYSGLQVVLLVAIVMVAAGLRLVGLDWDAGTHQHPDERHISSVMLDRLQVPPADWGRLLDPSTSELNPRSNDPNTGQARQFAYGSLPLILTEAVACGLDTLSNRVCQPVALAPVNLPAGRQPPYWTTYEHEYLVGRFLTVLADLGLILVSTLLARRAFGGWASLVTAGFLAASVVNIQLAHFFATDTWSALFAMAALWALYRAADRSSDNGWQGWALAGILAGASVASKVNTIGLGIPALVALWWSYHQLRHRQLAGVWAPLWPVIRQATVLALATLLSFAILEPYALLRLGTYLRDINEQAAILGSGTVDVPYTRQFVGTLPVWHYLQTLWGYGLGPGLTILGLAGIAAAGWRAWRRRSPIDIFLLSWFVAYGLLINTVFAKFMRYTLPLVPILAILGGALVVRASQQWLGQGRQRGLVEPPEPGGAEPVPSTRTGSALALGFASQEAMAGPATMVTQAHAPGPITVPLTASATRPASAPNLAALGTGSELGRALGGWAAIPSSHSNGDRQHLLATSQSMAVTTSNLTTEAEAVATTEVTDTPKAIETTDTPKAMETIETTDTVEVVAPVDTAVGSLDTSVPLPATGAQSDAPAGGYTGGRRLTVVRGLVALALLTGLIQALTFMTIYLQPHTRVAASRWIYDNIPAGSRIANETWDDSLPLGFPGGFDPGSYRYRPVSAKHYDDRPGEQGVREIEQLLRESDYITIASHRVYGSTGRMPWRYPVINRYYELLFAERLGFELAYANETQPTLGPYRLHSRWADESFAVYDHPPVHIFRKTATLSTDHVNALFAEAAARKPTTERTQPREKALLLTDSPRLWPDLSGEMWTNLTLDPWTAAGRWLVLLVLLGLVGLPWALLVYHPLADTGLAMARPLALLAIGYLAWLGASLRLYDFGVLSIFMISGAVGIAGWLMLWRRPDLLGDLVRQRWYILTGELVFWAAFAVQLLLRLHNPDTWHPFLGGEKPMETAFLSATLRSAFFPPVDPWFSGGYINYYYFGFVLVAIPIKLTGIPPQIAFNLAVATFYGMVAAGSCILGQTLARAVIPVDRPRRGWLIGGLGLFTSLLVVGIGNLDGFVQTIQLASRGWKSSNLPWLASLASSAIDRYDFWRSSRAMRYVITEFPYFSFLFADLHAHMIAMPLAIMVIGLALVLAIGHAPRRSRAWRPMMIWIIASGLVLGGLAVTNAWDVPAYTALLAGSAFIAAPFARRQPLQRGAYGGAIAMTVVALAYLFYLPFFQNFMSFYGSIGLTRIPAQLSEFLTIWGYFAALVALVIASWLVVLIRHRGLRRLTWPIVVVTLGTALATGSALARDLPAPSILFPMIGLLLLIWLAGQPGPAGELSIVLLIGGLAVIAGVEFVFLVDFLQGGEWYRMNTVFKLYLEAWMMLSIGLAGGLALVVRHWSELPGLLRSFGISVGVLGLVASLAYPVLVTPDRLRQRFDGPAPGATLDGHAFMEKGTIRDQSGTIIAFDEDLAAIRWMSANLGGLPIVAEAMIGPYRGNGSRITNATGFPTILGWDNHEGQQRWPDTIGPRVLPIRALYTSRTPEPVLAIIERYDVDYIYVGQVERKTTLRRGVFGATRDNEPYASPEGLATLESMVAGGWLRPVFREGETVIYHVLRPLRFRNERS